MVGRGSAMIGSHHHRGTELNHLDLMDIAMADDLMDQTNGRTAIRHVSTKYKKQNDIASFWRKKDSSFCDRKGRLPRYASKKVEHVRLIG